MAAPEDVRDSFRAHPTLSAEQSAAVWRLCRAGYGVDVVTAPAGTGKTSLSQAPGTPHVGTRRPSGDRGGPGRLRAAAELQASAGVPSTDVEGTPALAWSSAAARAARAAPITRWPPSSHAWRAASTRKVLPVPAGAVTTSTP